MKFTRILGVAAALAAASVMAQEAATVTPAPEAEPAPVVALEADNTPATFGDAAAGATKAAACAACHGLDGNSADPQYPKLAGQHENYIARQLSLYKSGERNNAIMLGFASTLSAQDMRDIGAYFASQKVVPGIADETLVTSGPNQGRKFYQVGERLFRAGKPEQGIPACQACHGRGGWAEHLPRDHLSCADAIDRVRHRAAIVAGEGERHAAGAAGNDVAACPWCRR